MKYAVLSPDHKLIGFDEAGQVAEYCLEIDGESLDDYCNDQELVYGTMSPTEIGQMYTNVGAVWGGCQIYETKDILKSLKDNDAEESYMEEAHHLFDSHQFKKGMNCPGYIEDVLGDLTPIYPAQMTDGIYFMDNIDSSSEVKDSDSQL